MRHGNARQGLLAAAGLVLLPLGAHAGELRGWPVRLDGNISTSSPAVGDVDGDGNLDVVVGAGLQLHVLNMGGAEVKPWPLQLVPPRKDKEKELAGGAKSDYPASPTLCDLNKDGTLEIALLSLDGKLHAYDGGAHELAGFPVEGGGVWASAPACDDLDGDGLPDLVWAGADGLIRAVNGSGVALKGFPLKDLRMAEGLLALGDFNGVKGQEIAFGGVDGAVHVLTQGKGGRWVDLPGFPVRTEFTVSGGPVMVDLNGDGKLELAFGSQDFNIFAVQQNGTLLPNFPVKTAYRVYAQPAAGDLDHDGTNELIVGGGDGQAYALDHHGQAVRGWPVAGKGRISATPAVGDLDADGNQEVVVCGGDGKVYILRSNGTPVGGFPQAPGGLLNSAPIIVDLDGDGRMEVLVATSLGWLHAYSFQNLGQVARPLVSWPTMGHDSGRVSRTRPNPALFMDLTVSPPGARTADDLSVKYTFLDLDGDPETNTQIRWFRNNVRVAELDNKPLVPNALTHKGEFWRYTLQEGADFKVFAENKGATIFKGPPITIRNTPPTLPVVAILPRTPSTVDALEVKVEQPSTDADGDPVLYAYRWFKNREPQLDMPLSASRVDPSRTRKGEVWRVVVIPTDGLEDGPNATAEVLIKNTPPSTPGVALTPREAGAAVPVKVVIEKPSTDPDEEPTRYVYDWKLMDRPVPFETARDSYPALSARRGQVLTLTVTPWDSDEPGLPVTVSTTLVNTPPSAPLPIILPVDARTDDALWAGISVPSLDHDMDGVAYTFQWTVDGVPLVLPAPETTVDKEKTRKGQKWALSAVPSDGKASGPPGKVELTIADTAPGRAVVEIEPARPRANESIRVVIRQDAPDVDGDRVSYKVRWLRNGQDVTAQAKDREVPANVLKKGETWQALVVAQDGTLDGVPAGAVQVRVGDTPPEAPVVALSPAKPRTDDILKVVLQKPAVDVDQDPVTYRYRWFLDGMLQDLPETQDNVPPERTHRGQAWRVVVVPVGDGVEGKPASAEATIINTPPRPPTLAIKPDQPSTLVPLLATLVTPATDADGDRVSVRYRWQRNGLDARVDGPLVPPEKTVRGDAWTLLATPNDGFEDGPDARANLLIVNTPPVPPHITVGPPRIKVTDTIDVRVVKAAQDVDGDAVKLDHAWSVDGKDVPGLRGKTRLAKGDFRKNQKLRVTVTPDDGALKGRPVTGDILVENTPPTAPKVRFVRASVAAPDPLNVEIAVPATDVDGDTLVYRYRYFRNGVREKLPDTTTTLAAPLIKRGDVWTVQVAAFDGEVEGPVASAEANVINGAPTQPKVAFKKPTVTVLGPLAVDITQPAKDFDGDTLSYKYKYTRNTKPAADIPEGVSRLPRRLLKKGDTWHVDVVAFDGWLASPVASSDAKVVNTPPTTPTVRFVNKGAIAGDRLDVEVTSPATDVDGDPISYRFQFYKGGQGIKQDLKMQSMAGRFVGANETWKVEVTAFDGEVAGPPALAEIRVAAPPPPPPPPKRDPKDKSPPPPPPKPEPRPELPLPQPPPPSPAPQVDLQEPLVDAPQVKPPPPLPVARCTVTRPDGKDLGAVRAGDPLRAQVAWEGAAATDARVVWLRNGKDASSPVAGVDVPPNVLRKAEVWQAVVRRDAVNLGACVELTVGETAPGAAAVALEPAKVAAGQGFGVRVMTPALDADGDAVNYRYRWYLNGSPATQGEQEDRVAPALVKKGDRWKVEVLSISEKVEGGSTSAETVVGNTPPLPPEIGILPALPRVGQQLQVVIRKPASDVDGDTVSLSYQWTLNGAVVQDLKGPDVPALRVKKGETWGVTVTPSDGETTGAGVQAAVTSVNTPPQPPVVTLGEPLIRAGAVVSFKELKPATDADGDPVTVTRRWLLNGAEVPEWAAREQIPFVDLKKNQRLRVEQLPHDGTVAGRIAFAEVQTRNTPPTAPVVAFVKPQVPVTEPLNVAVSTAATDADNDTLTYRYRFFRNGVRVPGLAEGVPEVPHKELHKGDRWQVLVVAFDGEEEGPPAVADASILNTMPQAPGLLVTTPANPRTTDALTCNVRTPAFDADGDTLRYVIRWLRNGVPQPLLPPGPLAPEATHKGEAWSCTAAAHDGEVLGPFTTGAAVTVVNSAPPAPEVSIQPLAPLVGNALNCRVAHESVDADGDPVAYTFHWERNGKPFPSLDGQLSVPGGEVRRGDVWGCWAQASDGELGSPQDAPRARVTVGNTAPVAPVVEIRPTSPVAGQAISCEMTQPAVDPDGDKVGYRVEWRKNGMAQGFAPTELVVAGRFVDVGQEWRCLLTASDGKLDSEPARSPPVTVGQGSAGQPSAAP